MTEMILPFITLKIDPMAMERTQALAFFLIPNAVPILIVRLVRSLYMNSISSKSQILLQDMMESSGGRHGQCVKCKSYCKEA